MDLIAPGRNVVLIGLMGAGKSTVGRILAERLGRPFVDTDDLVEDEAGMAIRDIFAEKGERAFRSLESEAVRRVSALRGQVVAVGGGAVSTPGNATQLRMTGDLVLLDADPAVLAERLGTDVEDRPMVAEADDLAARLAELRRRRDHDYARAASCTVRTDGRTPEEVADAILDWARHRPGLLSRDERE
ncbi:MAG TPA: shikimate kinase [Egibacteraceae bacterium]|nr:shikimate kinase [Egibacteraceae bacterium]